MSALMKNKIANMANYPITGDKTVDAAITEEKIDDSAVTGDKIANRAITEEKIDDGAVTSQKAGFKFANELASYHQCNIDSIPSLSSDLNDFIKLALITTTCSTSCTPDNIAGCIMHFVNEI